MSRPELAQHPTPKQRIISAAEMCLAILIVIAHNVFHWIPNEVPILFVLAIASFRIREGSWGSQLYRRPTSWPRTLLLATLCVVLLQIKDAILQPFEHYFSTAPEHVSSVITQCARPPPRPTEPALHLALRRLRRGDRLSRISFAKGARCLRSNPMGHGARPPHRIRDLRPRPFLQRARRNDREHRLRAHPRRCLSLHTPPLGQHHHSRPERHPRHRLLLLWLVDRATPSLTLPRERDTLFKFGAATSVSSFQGLQGRQV